MYTNIYNLVAIVCTAVLQENTLENSYHTRSRVHQIMVQRQPYALHTLVHVKCSFYKLPLGQIDLVANLFVKLQED